MGNVEHMTSSTVNVLKQDKLFLLKRQEEVAAGLLKLYGK